MGVVTGSLGLLCARLRRPEVTATTGDVGLRMVMRRIPSVKIGSSAFFSPRSMILAMVS